MGELIHGKLGKVTQKAASNGTMMFFYDVEGKVVSAFKKLDAQTGDSVSLPVARNVKNGKEYINLDENRIEDVQVTRGTKQAELPDEAKQEEEFNREQAQRWSADDYWRAKFEHEKVNSVKIGRQSNWNTAAALLHQTDAKFPGSGEAFNAAQALAHKIEEDVNRKEVPAK